MYKYAELQLIPFDNMLYVYIGKCKDVNSATLTKFNYNLSEESFNCDGMFKTIKKNYIVWCENKSSLLHEVSHCVDKLMEHYNIFDTEFRAYYEEYLYKCLKNDKNYKIMNKKKVKK